MKCPKCTKISLCFCKSCKARYRMPRLRREKISDEQTVQCPYCREKFTMDYLEYEAYKEYKNKP